MPSSRFLISSQTLGSAAASVTFSSIPATYTDLVVRISARSSNTGGSGYSYMQITYNGTTSGYSDTLLYKDGTNATPQSQRASSTTFYSNAGTGLPFPDAGATVSTFGSTEIYIPSYTVSQNKPASVFAVQENNSTTQFMAVDASLWSNTAAITSITITAGNPNFVSGSSFYLYGLKNS